MIDQLEVARAACLEVGLDPHQISMQPNGRLKYLGTPGHQRATWLGVMAAKGPAAIVRCDHCACFGSLYPPCTPVRDALRGLTCGRPG